MSASLGERLVVATHNQGKLDEIRALFAGHSLSIVSAGELGLAEPAETETTFAGNARIKAHAAARATGLPALADDSGLCVADLNGDPGVYTADWAETANGRDFNMAMSRVHETLLLSKKPGPWGAEFVCTLVVAWPDGQDVVFEGRIPGEIVWPGRGAEGHGYDPIFQPLGSTRTFAEMDHQEKNLNSHRGRAFAQLLAHFT